MLIWIFELIWKKPDVNIRPHYTLIISAGNKHEKEKRMKYRSIVKTSTIHQYLNSDIFLFSAPIFFLGCFYSVTLRPKSLGAMQPIHWENKVDQYWIQRQTGVAKDPIIVSLVSLFTSAEVTSTITEKNHEYVRGITYPVVPCPLRSTRKKKWKT